MKAIQMNQLETKDTTMDTIMAMTRAVMRPRGLGRGALAAAIFAGQLYKSSASTVVPWMNEDKQSQQNVKLMMIVLMVIFTMGICLGCWVQWDTSTVSP